MTDQIDFTERSLNWGFSYVGSPESPYALKNKCSYCCWFSWDSDGLTHVEGYVRFQHHRTIPYKRPFFKPNPKWTVVSLSYYGTLHETHSGVYHEFGKKPKSCIIPSSPPPSPSLDSPEMDIESLKEIALEKKRKADYDLQIKNIIDEVYSSLSDYDRSKQRLLSPKVFYEQVIGPQVLLKKNKLFNYS